MFNFSKLLEQDRKKALKKAFETPSKKTVKPDEKKPISKK